MNKKRFPHCQRFVRGIHRFLLDSPHKVTRRFDFLFPGFDRLLNKQSFFRWLWCHDALVMWLYHVYRDQRKWVWHWLQICIVNVHVWFDFHLKIKSNIFINNAIHCINHTHVSPRTCFLSSALIGHSYISDMFKARDAKPGQCKFPVGFPVRMCALTLLFINNFDDVVLSIQSRCVIKVKHVLSVR